LAKSMFMRDEISSEPSFFLVASYPRQTFGGAEQDLVMRKKYCRRQTFFTGLNLLKSINMKGILE
jgi:hypothetical protein